VIFFFFFFLLSDMWVNLCFLFAGGQADMQKLKEEVETVKTKLKEARLQVKREQRQSEKARTRAGELEEQLNVMRQENDERLRKLQAMERAGQQKRNEQDTQLKAMEQELEELREKVKATGPTKAKRHRQPDPVPILFEDEDLDDVLPQVPIATAAPPLTKKAKTQVLEPQNQSPQPDSAAMIEAAVLRCMERFVSMPNPAATPMAHQRPPQAPMTQAPTVYQPPQAPMPQASMYQQPPAYGSMGPGQGSYGVPGQYGQALPAPGPQMASAGMAYGQAPPAMMPSMAGGGVDQNAMMHMWPPQVPGAAYPTTTMTGWGTAGAGGAPMYPGHGQQATQMPMGAPAQSSMDPRSSDRAAKAATEFSQTGQFMAQYGTQEQQDAYAKFMQSLGGQ
jgi:F0F1-type ATP synthase membrane subunit b/b'